MVPTRLRGIDGGPVSPQELEDRWEIKSLPWDQWVSNCKSVSDHLFWIFLIGTCFGYGTPVDIYLTHSTICRVFSQCEEARTVLLRRWLPEVFSNQNILVSLIVK